MFSVLNIVSAAVLAVAGFLLGPLCCKLLNRIPPKWLCDYDEEPSEELRSGKRFAAKPHGIIMGVVLAVLMGAMPLFIGVTFELPIVILMYVVLMLISASDAKYTIIPDQFTVAAAIIAVIFAVVDLFTEKNFISTWYDPLLGAVCGPLLLIVLDIFSTLMFKKEGFGFGDIKLLAPLGFMFGWKYTIVLLVLSFLIAAVHFLVLIFSGKAKKGIYLPMGPYICLATALTLILQPQLEKLFGLYRLLMSMDYLP